MRPPRDKSVTPTRLGLWKNRAARFLTGAGATLSGAFLGILRNKWLALHLHASGLGVLAQVTSGQIWLGTLAGMGLSLPVARAIGAAGGLGDPATARRTIWTALSLVGIGSSAVAAVGLLFARPISTALLGTPDHALLVQISMLGVTGVALQGILSGLFAGRSDIGANLALSLGGGTAAVLVTWALVPRLGLAGGALGAAVLAPAGVAVALFFRRRSYAGVFTPKPERPFDPALARSIIGIGAAALLLSLVDLGTMLSVRAHYLRVNGIAANGLLQAALSLSQQVGAVFGTYISSYAFGKVSAIASAAGSGGVRAYTRKQWTPFLLLAAVTVAAAMVAATPLLHLLYSSRFDPARPMVAWALVGEFCRVGMIGWAVGALPLGGARLWVPIGLAPPAGLAISYAVLANTGAGVVSLPLAYLASGFVSLCFGGIAMSRAGVAPARRDIALALACAAALAALAARVAR